MEEAIQHKKTLGQRDIALFSVSAILLLDTLAAGATGGPSVIFWWLFFDFRHPAQRKNLYEPGVFQTIVDLNAKRVRAGAGPQHPAWKVLEFSTDDQGSRIALFLPWKAASLFSRWMWGRDVPLMKRTAPGPAPIRDTKPLS